MFKKKKKMNINFEEIKKDPQIELAFQLIYTQRKEKEGLIILEELEKNGNKNALYLLSYMYYTEKIALDNKKIIEYFIKLTKYKEIFACYNLGVFYRDGKRVERDFGKAIQYFELGEYKN